MPTLPMVPRTTAATSRNQAKGDSIPARIVADVSMISAAFPGASLPASSQGFIAKALALEQP
jgi:hypothetical protein